MLTAAKTVCLAWAPMLLHWCQQLHLYVMLPAIEVTTDKLSHEGVQAMLLCRLLKSRECLLAIV